MPPRATSCRSRPWAAACAACTSAASSAKPCRSWARPPSWSLWSPSRAKASPSSVCPWAARGEGAQDSLVVEVETERHGQEHRRARYRGAAPDPPLQSRVQRPDRAGPLSISATEACRSRPSRRKRPARSSSRPCSTARSITRSSSMAPGRATTARSWPSSPASLLKDLRLVGGYDQLYPKVKDLHPRPPVRPAVDLEDPVMLRNLSEPEVGKVLFDQLPRRHQQA
jgi:hypothetical protein